MADAMPEFAAFSPPKGAKESRWGEWRVELPWADGAAEELKKGSSAKAEPRVALRS